jgi:hypothetical protein
MRIEVACAPDDRLGLLTALVELSSDVPSPWPQLRYIPERGEEFAVAEEVLSFGGGDCDDAAVLYAAAFLRRLHRLLGVQWELRAVDTPRGPHVMIYIPAGGAVPSGGWTIDPTRYVYEGMRGRWWRRGEPDAGLLPVRSS